jgi:FdhD protein
VKIIRFKDTDIARERLIRLNVNGREFCIYCTPDDLEDLAVGLAYMEGLNPNFSFEEVKPHCDLRVKAKEKFSIEEIEDSLKYLDLNDETRAHHIAALVGKNGLIARAIDVSRHNAVCKAIGKGVKKNVDFSRLFLLVSSRISYEIALKCLKAGIPLIVSKKAIFDSAIELCLKTGLSAVSFMSGIIVGDAVECSDIGRWERKEDKSGEGSA